MCAYEGECEQEGMFREQQKRVRLLERWHAVESLECAPSLCPGGTRTALCARGLTL